MDFKAKNIQKLPEQSGGFIAIIGTVIKILLKVLMELLKILKYIFIREGENGIEAGPIAKMLWKFLKFSVKSSFILILFLMGGSFFMFIGIFYVYYRLYSQIKARNKDLKKDFKEQ